VSRSDRILVAAAGGAIVLAVAAVAVLIVPAGAATPTSSDDPAAGLLLGTPIASPAAAAATGTIVEESFSSYPRPYRVEQQGGAPGKIALTFDDGPDPRFTAPVLDILRDRHVMATFFVTV